MPALSLCSAAAMPVSCSGQSSQVQPWPHSVTRLSHVTGDTQVLSPGRMTRMTCLLSSNQLRPRLFLELDLARLVCVTAVDRINMSSREGLGRELRSAVKDSQWRLQTLARFSAPV